MRELLNKISEENLLIDVVDGELQLFTSKEEVNASLIAEIKNHKEELRAYLIKHKNLSFDTTDFQEIPKCPESINYPLSNSQLRLWLLSQLKEGSGGYNLPSTLIIPLHENNVATFQKAIYGVIARHEILRTVFRTDENGDVKQYILSPDQLKLTIHIKDYAEELSPETAARQYVKEDAEAPFDLSEGPLMRVVLLRLSAHQYMFYFNMHHIISDELSMDVLARDVLAYYTSYHTESPLELPELRIQYKDYAVWQLAQMSSEAYASHKQYWKGILSGELPAFGISGQPPRPSKMSSNGHILGTYISPVLSDRFRAYSMSNGGSLFMGALTVWYILFYKYSGSEDMIIGSPVSGRDHSDLKDQLGCFINNIAIRYALSPGDNFQEAFAKVKQRVLESYKHQEYPFDQIIIDLNLQNDMSRNPIFDVMFSYHTLSDTPDEGVVLDVERIIDQGSSRSKLDLLINFSEYGEYLYFNIEYNRDLYRRDLIVSMMKDYKLLMDCLLSNEGTPVGVLDYQSSKGAAFRTKNQRRLISLKKK